MTTDLQAKTEEFLADLVSEVSEIRRDQVAVDTDFQALGLDSRFVIAINTRLEAFFRKLPRTLFFEYPSIRSLAGYLVDEYRDSLVEIFESAAPPANDFSDLSELVAQVPLSVAQPSRTHDSAPERVDSADIAIIGVAGRYPKARNIEEFWRNLREGRDCVEPLPQERWTSDPASPLRWGGYIDGVAEFDALFFNISPRIAEIIDPQERLFLETAWETIESAGYDPLALASRAGPDSVGVFVGVMYGEYQLLTAEHALLGAATITTSSYASIANRVSHVLDFTGPSMAVDTMCSSSLTALHLAVGSLRSGDCRVALAGGVNVTAHPQKYRILEAGMFLASDGRCRSYGEGGDGYVPAEGVGAVLLKPLQDALRDGDTIWGVIKGTSINHGGRARAYSVPDVNAQAASLARVLERAKVEPMTLGYIEGHGTGTALGDPIEFRGVHKALGSLPEKIAIGSVKSNIGHAESAAGIAGLTKVLLQLRAKELVPSLHCEPPNPNIDFDRTPLRVQHEIAPWVQRPVPDATGLAPRRAVIASFGAGGSNAHVVIEEAPDAPRARSVSKAPRVFFLSAKSDERLRAHAKQMLDYLARLPPLREPEASEHLYDLCATLALGRSHFDHRLAVVADSHRALQQRLAAFAHGASLDPSHVVSTASASRGPTDSALGGLARQWVTSSPVDLDELYSQPWRKLSLPTYPFDHRRYWPTETLHDLKLPSGVSATPRVEPVTAAAVEEPPSAPTAVSTSATIGDWLRALVAHLLRIEPDAVEMDKSLFSYGLESVMAVEFAERTNAAFGLQLTPTLLFEFRTLAEFSRHLIERHGVPERLDSGAPVVGPRPAAVAPAAAPQVEPTRSASGGSMEELWQRALSAAPESVTLHDLAGEDGRNVEYALIGKGEELATSSSQHGFMLFGGLLSTHELLTQSSELRRFFGAQRSVLVHPPGAGRSELPDGELSLEFIVHQAERVRQQLGLETVTLIGYSFGGIVAQAYAATFPQRVVKVALICTTSDPATVTEGMNLAAAELERFPEGLRAFQMMDFAKVPIYAKLAASIREDALEYRNIPTLVVAGAEDHYVPLSHAERVAQTKSQATVRVVPGAGHFLGLSHGRALVFQLERFIAAEASPPRPSIQSRSHGRARLDPQILRELESYLAAGNASSAAEIAPIAAQVGFLMNRILHDERRPEDPRNGFFFPAGIEAVDAAIRYGRRRGKLAGRQETKSVLFDPDGSLKRHFEFLPGERLFADLVFVEDAGDVVAHVEGDPAVGMVYLTSACSPAELESIFALCAERNIVSALAELHADAGEVLTPRLEAKPDVVVFDEALTGHALSFGACAIRQFQKGGVWVRQPDDFAVRGSGGMLGPAMLIARESIRRRFEAIFTSETTATLSALEEDHERTKAAFRKYVQPALVEGLDVFGLAGRQTNADRTGYTIEYDDGQRARVINCYLIATASVRGHTGVDIAKTVVAAHDTERVYSTEASARIRDETGFDAVFPAASPATAAESALKLGLLGARAGSTLLVLEGNPFFTCVGSLVSRMDPRLTASSLVEPHSWPLVISIDPFAEGAAAKIEAELAKGNVGFVWLSTFHFEWGGLRLVPDDVLGVIEKHRSNGRYLIGVDETYSNIFCGRFFHWQGKLARPDIVCGSAWSEGQLMSGYALTTAEVAERARERSADTYALLREQSRCELTAHATIEFFNVLSRERVFARMEETNRIFGARMRELQQQCPIVARTWGEGLVWALELDTRGVPRFVHDWISSFVWSECLRDPIAPLSLSMVAFRAGWLRVMPRFDIPEEQLDAAFGTLRRVLSRGIPAIVASVADDLERRGDPKRAALFRNVLSGFAA